MELANQVNGNGRIILRWQMVLGTLGFLEQLIWAATGNEPQWLILSGSMALLGVGAINRIGRGNGVNHKREKGQ